MKKLTLSLSLLMLASCTRAPKPEEPQKPPVEIDVSQAFIKEGKLHVRTTVKPLVNIRADELSVGIVGIRSGEQSVEESHMLSELTGKQIAEAGESLLADFEIESAGLSEYQVVCKWGNDSKSARAARGALEVPATIERLPMGVSLKDIVLRRVPVSCSAPPCDETCSFEAELANGTESKLKDISVALGVTFVPAGASPQAVAPLLPLQPEEQEVKLEGLEVLPREQKALEIRIEQPLVSIPDGIFVPHVRLLHYTETQ